MFSDHARSVKFELKIPLRGLRTGGGFVFVVVVQMDIQLRFRSSPVYLLYLIRLGITKHFLLKGSIVFIHPSIL